MFCCQLPAVLWILANNFGVLYVYLGLKLACRWRKGLLPEFSKTIFSFIIHFFSFRPPLSPKTLPVVRDNNYVCNIQHTSMYLLYIILLLYALVYRSHDNVLFILPTTLVKYIARAIFVIACRYPMNYVLIAVGCTYVLNRIVIRSNKN